MATLDVCFDNWLGGGVLSARQIASLSGQTAKATESHTHSSVFGTVQVVVAGAWDDTRVDMILSGEEPVIARFRQDGVDRPQVSIGYTRMGDDPHYVALSDVALLGHARTIELPNPEVSTESVPSPEQVAIDWLKAHLRDDADGNCLTEDYRDLAPTVVTALAAAGYRITRG